MDNEIIQSDMVFFEISAKIYFKRQLKFHLFAFKTKVLKFFLILVAYVVLLSAYSISVKQYSDLIFNAVMLGIAVIIIVISIFAPIIDELYYNDDIPDKYIFYADRVVNIDFHGSVTAYYKDIKAAYETEEYFYINLVKNSYGIIDKDKFSAEAYDEFRRFLYEKLGDKFKMNR